MLKLFPSFRKKKKLKLNFLKMEKKKKKKSIWTAKGMPKEQERNVLHFFGQCTGQQ